MLAIPAVFLLTGKGKLERAAYHYKKYNYSPCFLHGGSFFRELLAVKVKRIWSRVTRHFISQDTLHPAHFVGLLFVIKNNLHKYRIVNQTATPTTANVSKTSITTAIRKYSQSERHRRLIPMPKQWNMQWKTVYNSSLRFRV